ncbi:MAG TPA: coproporphyrinogen III oxidase, partial [Alphaproteobacteria bacterium]|nr:coproporphyrinogen III oxidase [Alphaproteobacteria bacterium]
MTRSRAIKVNSFPSKKRKEETTQWFRKLRNLICKSFEGLEKKASTKPAKFKYTKWKRSVNPKKDEGGGEIAVMHGKVFEKVGVNISTVYGKFSKEFRKEIPGANRNPNFWASGISLVAHTQSPLIPAVHMNTRHI